VEIFDLRKQDWYQFSSKAGFAIQKNIRHIRS